MDTDKTIELLNRKIKREKAARQAAEGLLEQKSHELYLAKQLVEENLLILQEQAEKDVALLKFKSYLDSILLDYSQRLLQEPPINSLLQGLLDDLVSLEDIQTVQLISTVEKEKEKELRLTSGYDMTFDAFPASLNLFLWSESHQQISVYLHLEDARCGVLQVAFHCPPSSTWYDPIAKQFCLFSEMLSAAFERQALLEKTLKEKQRAEGSEKATRDFVAMINHELRTPLNGLLGSAELMEDTTTTEYQQRLLTTIHQSGEMLRVIINDLLDFSKMSAGMLQLKSSRFETSVLFQTIKDIFSHQVEEKRLSFILDIAASIPSVLQGDVDRIQQILVNLIGNAIKFTKEGEIKLTVTWLNNALVLEVADSGCGIPKDRQETLFDPFIQVDNSSQRQFEGTGLGLSICKSLVEKMAGTLVLESEIGQGSTFTVSLPLSVMEEQNSEHQQYLDINFSLKSLSILAVEDIKMNQVILNMMLKKLEITPVFSNDGQEALTFLEANAVDIILMDCRMPIMDGFETTRRLREQGYDKPIIALTAGTTSVEIEACLNAGMDDLLHKPYKAQELEVMLKKWGQRCVLTT